MSKRLVEHICNMQLPKNVANEYLEAKDNKLPKYIIPVIRTITADKITRNTTRYKEEGLIGNPEDMTGLSSFTNPYPIPVIKDHLDGPNSLTGAPASEVYGRVFNPAEFVKKKNEAWVQTTPLISHPEAVEGVLTGRWCQVSLGSVVSSIICSISDCQKDIVDEACGHMKGNYYEVNDMQELCIWDVSKVKAREQSFVVVPSDDSAGVLVANLKESAADALGSVLKLYASDDKGMYDLSTGKVVNNDKLLKIVEHSFRNSPIKFWNINKNISKKENVLLKESSEDVESKNVKENFKGQGRYLLMGWEHDHEVQLNGSGDGKSSPAADGHTHMVEGGVCRVYTPTEDDGGMDTYGHTHYLEVVHASKESEESDDTVVDYKELYVLDEDPTEEDLAEAKLSTKQRNKLPDSVFCGPNRSFPCQDKAHVTAALRLVGRSKLSASQKARVRACAIRKGKKMGMTFNDEAAECAVVLKDPKHMLEVKAHKIPKTAEELTQLVETLDGLPYTPDQLSAIKNVLAYGCKELGAETIKSSLDVDVPDVAPEPVEISINEDNYGVVYTLFEYAEKTVDAPEVKTEEKTEPEVKTVEVDKPETVQALESAKSEIAELKTKNEELTTQVETLRPLATGDDSKAEKILSELTAEKENKYRAEAELAALYMITLKKNQARDKSPTDLTEELLKEDKDSLKYRLKFLREDFENGEANKIVASIPVIESPLEDESVVEQKESEESKEGGNTIVVETSPFDNIPSQNPALDNLVVMELELDEDDYKSIQNLSVNYLG